jgi:hypothetical protein
VVAVAETVTPMGVPAKRSREDYCSSKAAPQTEYASSTGVAVLTLWMKQKSGHWRWKGERNRKKPRNDKMRDAVNKKS